MLILGLLLVVVSGAAGVLLIAYNNGGAEQTVTMFGRDLTSVSMVEAFVAGLVVALVFMVGLWMILSAGRRARENRARYREARREAKAAARERDELAEQLRKEEENRRGPAGSNTDTMVTPPVGTAVPHHGDASREPVRDMRDQREPMRDTRDPRDVPGAPTQPRHTAPAGQQQPVITNIKPGDSPTR
jgi:ABC-type nickel/cobalt efflux system permease component RcnA